MLLRAHWRPRFYSTSTKVQTVIVAYETKKETKPGREPTTIHRKKKPSPRLLRKKLRKNPARVDRTLPTCRAQ